jgi:hypothetical protein
MKPIKKLYIPFVECNIDDVFIINLFNNKQIANISMVTFMPSSRINYRAAILDIDYWVDTNYAYHIIVSLHNLSIDTIITYSEGKTITIQIYDENKHSNNNTLLINQNFYDLSSLKAISTNSVNNKVRRKRIKNKEWRDIEIALFHNNVWENLLFELQIY